MKFIVDMNLSPNIVVWLNNKGHDAIHVVTVNLGTASDESILEFARNTQRIIVTADLDFSRILYLSQAKSPGLILFRGGNYSESGILKLLQILFKNVPAQKILHSIVVLDKKQIRIRKLPDS